MKFITRDTDYAVRALSAIARDKQKVVPVPKLVRDVRIPRPFLRKILQALQKGGILKSYKGVGGGFSLSRPAGRIYLVEVIRIFQGDIELSECFFKKRPCPNKASCRLRKRLKKIEKRLVVELSGIAISDLL